MHAVMRNTEARIRSNDGYQPRGGGWASSHRHGTHGMPGNGWLGNSSTVSQTLEKRMQETDEQNPEARQSATSRLSERIAWSGLESPQAERR